MLNENAKAWVAALRSGKYKQGRRNLITVSQSGGDRHYCCLGVACELAVAAGVIPPPELVRGKFAFEEQTAVLPIVVRDWLGLQTDVGGFSVGHEAQSLANKNDTGLTFDAIANIIESEPSNLFKA